MAHAVLQACLINSWLIQSKQLSGSADGSWEGEELAKWSAQRAVRQGQRVNHGSQGGRQGGRQGERQVGKEARGRQAGREAVRQALVVASVSLCSDNSVTITTSSNHQSPRGAQGPDRHRIIKRSPWKQCSPTRLLFNPPPS